MLRRKAIKMSKARAADLKQFSRKDDDIRASLWEGIQDFEKQPKGGFSLVALRKAGGARSGTDGERGSSDNEDATPRRLSHTPAPPFTSPPPGGGLKCSKPVCG